MKKFKIVVLDDPAAAFDAAADIPVLISMEKGSNRSIKVGCRGGGCGICKVRIMKGRYHCGKMSRLHVSEAEMAEKYALACCLYPDSDLEIKTKFKEEI